MADDAVTESDREPSPRLVGEQLERVLASDLFAAAPVLSRFLRHVVEHSIEGRQVSLKEYAIGVDVFDRGADFDPRIDTIVRVQARRLRARLADYYATQGRGDAIVFAIPKGQYGAVISTSLDATQGGASAHAQGALQPGARHAAGGFAGPVPRTPLLGREQALAEVCGLLSGDAVRLLTITGAGGSGKTRLAIEAAIALVPAFSAGVTFVDLAAVNDVEGVALAIVQALGTRLPSAVAPLEAVSREVRDRIQGPLLLVLDNFEQVASAAPLVGTLLDDCANLRVLATARAALQLYGEQEYPLPPLAIPEMGPMPLDVLEANPAVGLFLQRAAAVRPGYRLDAGNAEAIATLCRRLDGLPLAIELVASQARLMSPQQMLSRFQGHLDLPENMARDVPERQRTLRRTLDWSYELLRPEEQRLFRRLGVFAGGFTAEAAEAVGNTHGDLEVDVEEGIAALLRWSLLTLGSTEGGEARYAMLRTIRDFAIERLRNTGEAVDIQRAHAAYCLVLAEEGVVVAGESETVAWLARCDVERDNFVVAFDGLLARREREWALRLGQALYAYWERREYTAEAARRLQSLLDVFDDGKDDPLLARVLMYRGALQDWGGDQDAAARLFRRALDIYRRLGDAKGSAAALTVLGVNATFREDFLQAEVHHREAHLIACELGDPRAIAGALDNRAKVAMALGEHGHAQQLLREAIAVFHDCDDVLAVAWSTNHLGDALRESGDLQEARMHFESAAEAFEALADDWGRARSLLDLSYLDRIEGEFEQARSRISQAADLYLALGHRRGLARLIEGCARLAAESGEGLRALMLAGASEALRSRLGISLREVERERVDEALAEVWESLDHASAVQAWRRGLAMSLPEAIDASVAV